MANTQSPGLRDCFPPGPRGWPRRRGQTHQAGALERSRGIGGAAVVECSSGGVGTVAPAGSRRERCGPDWQRRRGDPSSGGGGELERSRRIGGAAVVEC